MKNPVRTPDLEREIALSCSLDAVLEMANVTPFSEKAVKRHKEEERRFAYNMASSFARRNVHRADFFDRIAERLCEVIDSCKYVIVGATALAMMIGVGILQYPGMVAVTGVTPSMVLTSWAVAILGSCLLMAVLSDMAISLSGPGQLRWTVSEVSRHNDIPIKATNLMADLKNINPQIEFEVHRIGTDPLIRAKLRVGDVTQKRYIFGWDGDKELAEELGYLVRRSFPALAV